MTSKREFELLILNEMDRIARARARLIDFTRFTKSDYEINWHHEILAHYLDLWADGKIRRLMVFMPPRHGKTELVSRRLPAFILGKNPNASIIGTSYSADLASLINRDVQRIIDAREYAILFPESKLFGANVRTTATGTWLRNSDIFEIVGRRGVYRSAGVGGAITGMGGEFCIIDDPIKNADEANSATYRARTWDWYASTLYTRLEKNARLLVTMTRWHEDDLAGRLLQAAKAESGEQWTILSLPAICEEESGIDRRKIGEPLWENKFNADTLNQIKTSIGSHYWNALYQQRPSAREGGIFKRANWRFYREPPPKFEEVVQSWDCTFKDVKTSDFVVGQVWGRAGANFYCLDRIRGRMDFPKTIEAILMMTAKHPNARMKLIEDKANGPAIISVLKDKVSGILPVNPEGSKEARAHAVSPYFEAGNVYAPDPTLHPWVDEMIEECATFPTGKHDDQVDAMTQALAKLGLNSSLTRLRNLVQF